jgi:ABC-type molybdate transport system substrate-binding protein
MAETAPATPPTLDWYVAAMGEDADYAKQSALDAAELLAPFIGVGNPYAVPAGVVARAVLEVGADLYYRKASRNGVVGLDSVEPQPFRLNRDPLAAGYPFLRPFIPWGL